MKRYVRIVLDPSLPAGQYRVGGVRIVQPHTDAELGREINTQVVACRGHDEADYIRELLSDNLDLEILA